MRQLGLSLIFLLVTLYSNSQTLIEINQDKDIQEAAISQNSSYYIDTSKSQDIEAILHKPFTANNSSVLLYPIGTDHVWIKFTVLNKSDEGLFFDMRYTNVSLLSLYKESPAGFQKIQAKGNTLPYTDNSIISDFVMPLDQAPGSATTYLLEIKSKHPIVVPAYICTGAALYKANAVTEMVNAAYAGILGVMLFYNIFVFIFVRDRSYLIYVLYTFCLFVAQFTAAGFMFKYIWPLHPAINNYAVVCTTSISFISGILFEIYFLQVKKYTPRLYWLLISLISFLCIVIVLNLFRFTKLSYTLLNYGCLITGVVLLIIAIKITRTGYRPAYLYFVAWSSVLVGLIILSLRNFGILPYNTFTSNVMYIGTAIETILLSIALADRINIFRNEKEKSQAEAVRVLKENEKLITEQNTILEVRIKERTKELEEVNENLTEAMNHLQDTQIQLVESEKMASLGQLTAGIAHEINNPINFVKSNVKPLQMDVKDLFCLITEYQKLHSLGSEEQVNVLKQIRLLENNIDPDFLKEEIENLIDGIEEGAERTAEIVRGLRNFSRLDESELKEVNIYENIESTLILLRNTIPGYIKVVKKFEARSQIECLPGKLNQVFMNIITNAIQAIQSKPEKGDEKIEIKVTESDDDSMIISISDTGTGMTDEVKRKIFDPFFTTKDVGEGTGLGMAIVFKIIEKHHGKITVVSSPGEGSQFIIELPYVSKFVTSTMVIA